MSKKYNSKKKLSQGAILGNALRTDFQEFNKPVLKYANVPSDWLKKEERIREIKLKVLETLEKENVTLEEAELALQKALSNINSKSERLKRQNLYKIN